MSIRLNGISSMATRTLLADLVPRFAPALGVEADIASVGGVDAARRVRAGEALDLVVLASDVIDALIAEGHLLSGSRVDLVRSGVAVCVRAGTPWPDLSSADAVREAVLRAPSLSYSTGPSGVALARQFEAWGIAEAIQPRLVTAPPGVPVGRLVAEGQVALGFQQLSELIHVQGIDIVGPLPAAIQVDTVFSAGIGRACAAPQAARALLAAWASPEATPAKQRQGMDAA